MIKDKIKNILLEYILNSDEIKENIQFDNFIKQCCRNIANIILSRIYSCLSKEGRQKIQNNSWQGYLDDHFNHHLDFMQNKGYSLDIPFYLDGKEALLLLVFLPTDRENTLAFCSDENLLKENVFSIKYFCKVSDKGVPMSDVVFLFNHKNYLVHELSHLILDMKTKTRASKTNTTEYKKHGFYYYNCPTEFNAYYKQLLIEMDDYAQGDYKKLSNILNTRNEDELIKILMSIVSDSEKVFLYFLSSVNKRKLCGKIYDYIDTKISKREGIFEDIFWAVDFYKGAKPTQHDLRLCLDEIKEGLSNNENNK